MCVCGAGGGGGKGFEGGGGGGGGGGGNSVLGRAGDGRGGGETFVHTLPYVVEGLWIYAITNGRVGFTQISDWQLFFQS